MSCVSSRAPTSAMRSSCEACSRAPPRASPPSAAYAAASCEALREVNDAIAELVHRADYESFERYVEPQRALPRPAAQTRAQPAAGASPGECGLAAVRRPRALVLAEAELAESRDILVIAHRQHTALIEAIEQRQGARAENVAREHARLALTNLDIVLGQRDALDRLPGASLLSLPLDPRAELEPEAEPV